MNILNPTTLPSDPGETIFIPAGEKHWHGAPPDSPMAHVALNIDLETEWLEPVPDEQYRAV
jgi:4-carboxymuconolactone decarboxylase